MLRRPRIPLLGALALSSLLASCAEVPPPPPEPPAVQLAPPAPPPAPPPLLVVPRGEASPRDVPEHKEPEVPALRSEGKRHALERMAHGVVVLSEERGVLGFLVSPVRGAEIRWAGFVADDAILIVADDTIHRAATPDDAVAGKTEAIGKIDPAATTIASAGKLLVAAVPAAGGAFYVSRDGGKHLSAEKRPAPGAIADLAVRGDGVVVAAIEKEAITDERGTKGVRTQILVGRGARAWSKGPLADSFFGPPLTQRGDAILVLSPKKPGDASSHDTLGLDAKGAWIPAGYPDFWLDVAWTSTSVEAWTPTERPGFPKGGTKDGQSGIIGGVVGSMGPRCEGVACLARRSAQGAPPRVKAFHDGVCAPEHVTSHDEKLHVIGDRGQPEREETHTFHECDPAAPVRRASTLLVPAGEDRRLVKLPVTCADGRVIGTDRASFVYCSAKHRGRPAILQVSPTGAMAEVASGVPGDLEGLAAESASDATTLMYAGKGAWICRAAEAAPCAPIPHDGFLAARPLPGGRALVARRGATPHELVIELLGEPGAVPVRVATPDNVLEIETTAEGYVRLWTSPTIDSFGPPQSFAHRREEPRIDALLVRADGQLVPDAAAKEAFLRAVGAARR